MRRFTYMLTLLVLLSLSSCLSNNETSPKGSYLEGQVNDSVTIKMNIDSVDNRIIYLRVTNINNQLSNLISFHEDGITPLIVAQEYQGERDGVYYTYFPSGRLNNKAHYESGVLNGSYLSFSEEGDTIYYATYMDGEESQIMKKEPEANFVLMEEE